MGRVLCEKHGSSSGPLCCRHVLDAVGDRGPVVSFQRVTFHAAGDGERVIGHLICEKCLADYGLPDQVTEAVWGDESRFPWVCPVCEGCLSEYETRTKCEQG